MSDFATCIPKVASKLPKEVRQRLTASNDPNRLLDEYVVTVSIQKKEAALQAVRLAEAMDKIDSHPKGFLEGLLSLMAKDRTGRSAYNNVDKAAEYYRGVLHSRNADMLEKMRTKLFGVLQDKAGLEKFVKAVYGATTDDASINTMAKDWLETVELARRMKNKAGASINKNERFLFPQNHNDRAIKKVGLETWKNNIRPMLDRARMLDDNGKELTEEAFEDLLNYVFESITTHGLNKVKDLTVPRLGKKLSRRGSERRILYFKDAESWIAYNKTYGKGDIFTTLTDWLDSQAHDTALLEIMGPNPNETFAVLMGMAEKRGVGSAGRALAKSVFSVVSGKTNNIEHHALADGMQAFRNIITSAFLGKAFLSATSDTSFTAITAKYNGLSPVRTFGRLLKQLNPASTKDQKAAVRIGLIADSWVGISHAANKYADIYGTGATAKISEFIMRASLLKPWTDSGRKAFGMEFSGVLADNFGTQYNKLDPLLRRAFDTYGITASDWNTFRKTKKFVNQGAEFADFTQNGGKKFHQMVMSETDFAVPTPDAMVRAVTTGGYARGTAAGEAWRSAFQIKSFPITIAMTHFYRFANQSTMADKAAYGGQLLVATTVMGGLALQAKDIAAGRDPRPINTPEFFGAALVQGGGISLVGDFMYSDYNRYGNSFGKTLVGPIGDFATDVGKLTLGNIQELIPLARGEIDETHATREMIEFTEKYFPSTWQVHLFKQAFFNQLEMAADPKAARRYRTLMKKRKQEYNQEYWWRPDTKLTDVIAGKADIRAPEFEGIIED